MLEYLLYYMAASMIVGGGFVAFKSAPDLPKNRQARATADVLLVAGLVLLIVAGRV